MRCPICNREFDSTSSQVLPFCSPRCQQVDLSRWLGEAYGLPHAADDEALEEEQDGHELRGHEDDDEME